MSKKKPNEIKREKMPYRDCAGCVVFNSRGQVLVCERKSSKKNKNHVWQFPQGGIDGNEEPIDAAMRELFEETSIHSVSLITAASNWIYYDLPDDILGVSLKGKFRGQRQKWFAFLFEGDESEINVIKPVNGKFKAEFSDWRWENLTKTPELIVPFKQKAYEEIVVSFEHIVKNLKKKTIKVKKLKNKHIDMWAHLRHKLFSDISRISYISQKDLKKDCIKILKDKKQKAYGVFEKDILVGFAEVRQREIGDGCKSSPVAWLEAIYILPNYRQLKLGERLLKRIENWARKQNLSEIGSDVEIKNERSIAAHNVWGFKETGRVALFCKKL